MHAGLQDAQATYPSGRLDTSTLDGIWPTMAANVSHSAPHLVSRLSSIDLVSSELGPWLVAASGYWNRMTLETLWRRAQGVQADQAP